MTWITSTSTTSTAVSLWLLPTTVVIPPQRDDYAWDAAYGWTRTEWRTRTLGGGA